MDYGHYNCRDYHISPPMSSTIVVSERNPNALCRHESFDELEQRSRSPASQKPKFPLMQLPLELRQHVLSYLLPHTQVFRDSGLLSEYARKFSAVQKRAAKGMDIPSSSSRNPAGSGISNVVWQRGNISLFCVCKQLHDECAELVYGTNTFLLFVTFNGISFRFRWLLPSGLAPSRSYNNFPELLPPRYMRRIKKVFVHVDHVDSYTAMIKFNVSGQGLIHGLRQQVRRLVNALGPVQTDEDGTESQSGKPRRLNRINIRVANGNAVIDALKSDSVRQREGVIRVTEGVEETLEPFSDLRGVHEVHIGGAVTEGFARLLEERMKGTEPVQTVN